MSKFNSALESEDITSVLNESDPYISFSLFMSLYTRAANLNWNSKELDHFAELELEFKKIFFLKSNSNLNSHKTVRVH